MGDERPESVCPDPVGELPRAIPAYGTDADRARILADIFRVVAIDLETRGLHPHASVDAAVGAIIVHVGGESFIFREFPDWWTDLLEDATIKKVLTNAKFDLTWMIDASLSGACGGGLTHARNIQDCMLKAQLVHDYRTYGGARKAGRFDLWRGNDLKSLLAEFLTVDIGKTIDHAVTDWTGPWTAEMVEYMLEDIAYLEPLNDALDRELLEQGQERAAAIEMDVVFGAAWMTYNGIAIDQDTWKVNHKSWWEMSEHLEWHLKKVFPTVLNFNSVQQLMAAMPDVLGAPVANLRKATLKQLAPGFPQLQLLLDYKHYRKMTTSWGATYLKKFVCEICGRLHPDWRQIGTETSRFSCANPNLQQIPRADWFRAMFVAAPGMKLASLDYSAIEVVGAAIYAKDKKLLEACATGNPHGATAAMTMGLSYEDWQALDRPTRERTRQSAKIVNFGLLFAGGVESLVKQARDMFDTILTYDEAKAMFDDFFKTFSGLKKTKNWAYRAMEQTGRVEVRNAVGFRRYLDGHDRKPTSWLNTWIQSSAGYGLKSSFGYLREASLLPFLCLQVHDELVFEFPEEDADALMEEAKACLIRGMKDVLGARAPVVVEAKVATVWLK